MKLYRVNYEEYLHYEEFIEADSEEHAEVIFRNSIETIEPVDGEVYHSSVEEVDKKDEQSMIGVSNK